MFFEKGFICHLRKGIYMLRKGLYIYIYVIMTEFDRPEVVSLCD